MESKRNCHCSTILDVKYYSKLVLFCFLDWHTILYDPKLLNNTYRRWKLNIQVILNHSDSYIFLPEILVPFRSFFNRRNIAPLPSSAIYNIKKKPLTSFTPKNLLIQNFIINQWKTQFGSSLHQFSLPPKRIFRIKTCTNHCNTWRSVFPLLNKRKTSL